MTFGKPCGRSARHGRKRGPGGGQRPRLFLRLDAVKEGHAARGRHRRADRILKVRRPRSAEHDDRREGRPAVFRQAPRRSLANVSRDDGRHQASRHRIGPREHRHGLTPAKKRKRLPRGVVRSEDRDEGFPLEDGPRAHGRAVVKPESDVAQCHGGASLVPCPENLLPHSSASADASASSTSRRPERDSKSSPMAFALIIENEIASHLTYVKKNTCCLRRAILIPFNVFPSAAALPKPSAPVLTKVVMRMVLSYIPIIIPSTRAESSLLTLGQAANDEQHSRKNAPPSHGS